MEREIMLTGIGGQGVQLAAQVLARAATLEEREVLSLGTYGGTMRGGNTESVVVVGDSTIMTPPIVSRVWGALVLHTRFWEPVRAKLRPGSVLVVDAEHFEEAPPAGVHLCPVPASVRAAEMGAPLTASLYLLGAFAAGTELIGLSALEAGMEQSLPPYRHQHLPKNLDALRAGFSEAPKDLPRAWATAEEAQAS